MLHLITVDFKNLQVGKSKYACVCVCVCVCVWAHMHRHVYILKVGYQEVGIILVTNSYEPVA